MKQQMESKRVIQNLHQELDMNKRESERIVATLNQSTVKIDQLEKELGNKRIDFSQNSMRNSYISQNQQLKSENMSLKLRMDEIFKKLNEMERVLRK